MSPNVYLRCSSWVGKGRGNSSIMVRPGFCLVFRTLYFDNFGALHNYKSIVQNVKVKGT